MTGRVVVPPVRIVYLVSTPSFSPFLPSDFSLCCPLLHYRDCGNMHVSVSISM